MQSYPSQPFAPPPAAPKKKSNSLLITCGIIVAVVVCLAIVGVGGYFLLNGMGGGVAADLSVAVTAPPPVSQSQDYQISVRLSNTGDTSMNVTELRLPKTVLESSTLRSVSPSPSGTADYDTQIGYKFDFTLDAGQSQTVTFDLTSDQPGDFSGDVTAATGNKTSTSSVRVVVNTGRAETVKTPVVQQPVATLAPADLGDIPYQAVVQIIAIVEIDGNVEPGWTGSGSIISPDGFILTNAHVVMSDRYYTVQRLLVAMTVAPDAPPEVRYEMELFQVDEAMDIAVGKITKDADGNPIDTSALNLPTVPLGSADSLQLGDPLTIIGYPGIGGATITLTRGEVSGFTAEDPYGNRAFIKTSATIAGGNSGGLAANADGELIGVPTQLGYGGDDQYVDCRVLTDTNRDGIIDDNDNCVPTGGFINALRPLTLAQPYIDAAKRGEVNIQTGVAGEQEEMPTESNVLFSDDFSSTANWPEESLSTGYVGYGEGYYYIQVDDPNQVIWSVPDGTYEDVVIQVDLQVLQGTGDSEYGVICRMVDGDNYYTLEISEDGYFSIWKRENGDWFALYDWEATDAYSGDSTTLYAGCIGNELTVAVDETVLARVTDDAFSSGQVGLFVGTFDNSGSSVGFDNFIVYGP